MPDVALNPGPPLSAESPLLCLVTAPDRTAAERLARALVDGRLAACVNILPGITSVYRWQGAVETGEEVLLLAKTMPGRLEALTARVAELHPFEVPEVIALDVRGGLPAYLQWIAAETVGSAGA